MLVEGIQESEQVSEFNTDVSAEWKIMWRNIYYKGHHPFIYHCELKRCSEGYFHFYMHQFSSVTRSCPLCDPMDCCTLAFPVHHQRPELTQTHVHWVSDTIPPFHPLLFPSPPDLNLSQHQGPFKWVSSSHQVAKVLEFQLQHQFFQWTFQTYFPKDGLVGSPCSPRDSQESSPTPQFKSINFLALSFLYRSTLTSLHDYWKNHSLD